MLIIRCWLDVEPVVSLFVGFELPLNKPTTNKRVNVYYYHISLVENETEIIIKRMHDRSLKAASNRDTRYTPNNSWISSNRLSNWSQTFPKYFHYNHSKIVSGTRARIIMQRFVKLKNTIIRNERDLFFDTYYLHRLSYSYTHFPVYLVPLPINVTVTNVNS